MDSQNQPNLNKEMQICVKVPEKNPIVQDDEDSSQWSLASLEDLKSMNIKEMVEDEEPQIISRKEKEPIEVKFPDKPTVLQNAPLHEVGKIIFIVGELLILQSTGHSFVVDLDNWLCDQQKNLIGFVIDVLGKIENPYYAIRPQQISNINDYLSKSLYYIQGSSKILKDQDIKSMKSKTILQEQDQQLDNSSEQEVNDFQRDYSEDIFDRKREHSGRRNNHKMNNNDNRAPPRRERTRQQMRQYRNQSRDREQNNKKYLEGIYSSNYHQMMRFYNPNQQHASIEQNNPFKNHVNTFVPHENIARFGSNNAPNQFVGQVFPMNSQMVNPFNNQMNSQVNMQGNNQINSQQYVPINYNVNNLNYQQQPHQQQQQQPHQQQQQQQQPHQQQQQQQQQQPPSFNPFVPYRNNNMNTFNPNKQ